MDVGSPTTQKICRLLIIVEFRKIGDMMRFVCGDIVMIFAMHVYVFSRAFCGCRDCAQPSADYATPSLLGGGGAQRRERSRKLASTQRVDADIPANAHGTLSKHPAIRFHCY